MHSKESLMAALEKLMGILHSMPDEKDEMEEGCESEEDAGMIEEKPKQVLKVSLKAKAPMEGEEEDEEDPEDLKNLKKHPNYLGKY